MIPVLVGLNSVRPRPTERVGARRQAPGPSEFVAHEAIDLSGRPDLVEQFRDDGLLQAPIIETSDGQRTAGFDPDRIKAIVAAVTPQQVPGSPGSSDGGGGGGSPTHIPQRARGRGEGMSL